MTFYICHEYFTPDLFFTSAMIALIVCVNAYTLVTVDFIVFQPYSTVNMLNNGGAPSLYILFYQFPCILLILELCGL